MPRRPGIRDVLRGAFASAGLRRVALAFAAFNAAEWAVWIALLVYAYGYGGATAASVAAIVQLVPAGLAAPFAARLADRAAPARVLAGGYLAQALTMAIAALALISAAPPAVVFVLAGLAASATTLTRPAQAALLPALVHGVDELTSANVVLGWIESVALLVAPLVAGGLLAVSVPGAVFIVMAALALGAAALVAGVDGPPAVGEGRDAVTDELLAGVRVVARDPHARLLTAVLAMEFVIVGALDVLVVVLAIDVVGLGDSGAGYLSAAFGAGGVVGIVVTVRLIGRERLMPALVAAALTASLALLALGLWHTAAAAFGLLALAGAGRVVLDVAARTLLQRSTPVGLIARVFGVLETLDAIGLALGSALAGLLVAVLGPGAAIGGLAILLPALLALSGRRLRLVDAAADVPLVEVALLRSHPIFSALRAPVLERLARTMTAMTVPAGERVIREGQPGERYYVVGAGRLEVSRDGLALATVARGDGVGEISLLAGVPCSATVTAITDVQLYAIEPHVFLDVVTSHAVSSSRAQRLVRERLASA